MASAAAKAVTTGSGGDIPPSGGDGAPQLPPANGGEESMAEMGFLDHLEEMRWRIFKGLGGVAVGAVVCTIFWRWVIDKVLLGPTRPDFYMYRILGVELEHFVLQNRTITGEFFAAIGTVMVVGVILGFPVLLYQFWKFIEPGLYSHEKQGARFSAAFAAGFFMLGVSFGYFIVVPLAMKFFASFELASNVVNEYDITRYFSMLTLWVFGAGILFELPVIIYFLSKLGILTPQILRKSRRFALVIVLVIAAFFTPPDPFTQLLMAAPLLVLYETSIAISAYVTRKRERELAEALR